jgi:hypothetical protein
MRLYEMSPGKSMHNIANRGFRDVIALTQGGYRRSLSEKRPNQPHVRFGQLRATVENTLRRVLVVVVTLPGRQPSGPARVHQVLTRRTPLQVSRAIVGRNRVQVIDDIPGPWRPKKGPGDQAVYRMPALAAVAHQADDQIAPGAGPRLQKAAGGSRLRRANPLNPPVIGDGVAILVARTGEPVDPCSGQVTLMVTSDGTPGKLYGRPTMVCYGPQAKAAKDALRQAFEAVGPWTLATPTETLTVCADPSAQDFESVNAGDTWTTAFTWQQVA